MLSKNKKFRNLSASDLGVGSASKQTTGGGSGSSAIADDDPVYESVLQVLDDGFAGVILTGPPGTSKSWYAREIALKLSGDIPGHALFVQFHPGYQYENFVEAYVPNDAGGFTLVDKTFLDACETAKNTDKPVVLVIDELSRTDVVRVFGEALTYMEKTKRGPEFSFSLASGRPAYIPVNLHIIGTMNPWDRGVDELDLAFERRFAKIQLNPDVEILKGALASSSLTDEEKLKVEQFFYKLSRHSNQLCRIGHAYFLGVDSMESLKRLWDHQLSFHFERVLRLDEDELADVKAAWERVITP